MRDDYVIKPLGSYSNFEIVMASLAQIWYLRSDLSQFILGDFLKIKF